MQDIFCSFGVGTKFIHLSISAETNCCSQSHYLKEIQAFMWWFFCFHLQKSDLSDFQVHVNFTPIVSSVQTGALPIVTTQRQCN